jgi:hypothetical protein
VKEEALGLGSCGGEAVKRWYAVGLGTPGTTRIAEMKEMKGGIDV